MGFLRRLRGSRTDVPEWAAFFRPDEYEAFVRLVEDDLRRRGLRFELEDGIALVDHGEEEPNRLGLMNLAQRCQTMDRSDWPAAISEHFSAMMSITGRDLDALAADYEQASRILRLRLYPDESMGGLTPGGDGAVLRRLAPGVLTGLVYDFPDSVASVSETQLADWRRPEAEVIDLARANTLAEPPPLQDTVDTDDGATFETMLGDSFYVASRLLGLADLLPTTITNGALVGVPNRHALLWHPIEDLRVVRAMTAMAPLIQGLFRDGPGSISNQLYWWRNGEVVHLPIAPNRKGFDFSPPDDFVALLNRLEEPAGDP
jgi:hypothetical protein